MKRLIGIVVVAFLVVSFGLAQTAGEKIDTAMVSKIKDEGMNHSQIMDLLSYLCDVYSPRLTWSPEYRKGAEWTAQKMKTMGLENVHFENWAPIGKGWTLKRFTAVMTEPMASPLIAYPKAWSPGVKGTVKAEAVYLDAKTEADLEKYKGKLKGTIVLVNDPRELKARFEPLAHRLDDAELLRMANAGPTDGRGGRRQFTPGDTAALRRLLADTSAAARRQFGGGGQQFTGRKLEFALKEGALVALDGASGDLGTMSVSAATVPPPQQPAGQQPQGQQAPGQQPAGQGGRGGRISPYDENAPQIIPQITVAAEHYNRMVRILQKGQKVKLELSLEVEFTKADSSFNVIAEIPGTDLKNEVVLLGAHFDTWHAGTGATDDNSGVAACIEAARILKTLGVQPRRTIRLGFWGGEEQGLIGSRQYVALHYAEREGGQGGGVQFMGGGGGGALKMKPEYENFSVYFNHDNGTGKFRGIYLQGNEAARSIFRAWLTPFASLGASTITYSNTGGTDHQSFDGVNLPGFQFIQDPIDYDTRTHHFNMDLYDRLQADDMKQAATIMAAFAYNAAMRDGKFPRKPMPAPAPAPAR
ncbi:MAG: M20/M25/M40 family metallo-hydrolase [bacterium]